jgi:hypothetical protein
VNEAARYKLAAQEALQQVDHCVEYLRRIRKGSLAARLSRNSEYIRRELLREPVPRRSRSRKRG